MACSCGRLAPQLMLKPVGSGNRTRLGLRLTNVPRPM